MTGPFQVRLPDRADVDTVDDLLAARDTIVTLWQSGRMEPGLAILRLRSLCTVDVDGHLWRIRPTEHGGVLIRLSPDGQVSIPSRKDFVPRRRRRAGVTGATLLLVVWAAVIVMFAAGR